MATSFEHDYTNFPELTNTQLEVLRFTSPHHQITEDFDALVVKVHDGDTITLRTSFRDFDFPLRFLDIDAPELSEGGQEARDFVKGRIEGENVRVLIDRNQRVGKYGRLLGKVLHMGTIVSEDLLRLGLTQEFGKKDAHKLPKLDKIFRMEQWF